jgi:hypothetical protein
VDHDRRSRAVTVTPFHRILTGADVEDAAIALMQKWMPTYLAEMERQTGRTADSLPHVRSWVRTNEFEKFPEDQLPAVLVICPGLADEPVKTGDGKYRAGWALGVAVVVSARDQAVTQELAKVYAAAIRALLLHHPSMEGLARGMEWNDERYDDLAQVDERTLSAARQVFTVEVDDVTTARAGPAAPDPLPDHHEPYPPDAIVPDRDHVDQTIELEEIGDA